MSHYLSWGALFAAALFGVVKGGKWNIPIAAWLFYPPMLYFMHTQIPAVGVPVCILLLIFCLFISLKGVVPLPLPAYTLFIAVMGVVLFIPFLVDLLFLGYFPGFWATLVFPFSMVIIEHLLTRYSPYSSWGSLAYQQSGNLSLIQIVSVTGIYGITFLICWFGSTLNWIWREGFVPEVVLPGILTCSGILGTILFAGGARLAFTGQKIQTVPVALITEADLPSGRSFHRAADLFIVNEKLSDEIWQELTQTSEEILNNLFIFSYREAQAGAKIIVWAEASGIVPKDGEADLLNRGQIFAKAHQVYLGLTLAVLYRDTRKFENKVVMINPDGEVAWQYHKRHPIPGPEAALTRHGDSSPKCIDTPYGRLGILICFDADFPYHARLMGKEKVDILVIPSSDWIEIGTIHSQMTVFRALENGFSVIRPARTGVSLAIDPYGRILGYLDNFTTTDRTLVAHVPIRGTRTIYSKIPLFVKDYHVEPDILPKQRKRFFMPG